MIHVGYEVGTGNPVSMRLTHTVFTGMTMSVKTTGLEAVIARSGCKTIAFKTKRGRESGRGSNG